MKRIRFGSILLFLALALGFAPASVPISSADEGSPKCSCMYPDTGAYGVRTGSDCVVQHCWIDLELD
ncbi:MAG: hypothetical protein AABN95_19465 [Acidobacteriota bacterium]